LGEHGVAQSDRGRIERRLLLEQPPEAGLGALEIGSLQAVPGVLEPGPGAGVAEAGRRRREDEVRVPEDASRRRRSHFRRTRTCQERREDNERDG